jgi:hypothetical protein
MPQEFPVVILLQRLDRGDFAWLERIGSSFASSGTQTLRADQSQIDGDCNLKQRMVLGLLRCREREDRSVI